jgi:hypothetical protein
VKEVVSLSQNLLVQPKWNPQNPFDEQQNRRRHEQVERENKNRPDELNPNLKVSKGVK